MTDNLLDDTIKRVNDNPTVDIIPDPSPPHAVSPQSLANLKLGVATQWKPGQSGNPTGDSVSLTARRRLDKVCEYDSRGRIWRDALADNLMRQALGDKTDAMRELLDRTEGRVQPASLGDTYNSVNYTLVVSERGQELVDKLTGGTAKTQPIDIEQVEESFDVLQT